MRRFFKKEIPTQGLWMSTVGKWLKFEPVDVDIGILSTDQEPIQKELDLAIRKEVGGITEIDQQAYEELRNQKKTQTEIDSNRPWREEFSMPNVQETITRSFHPNQPGDVAAEPATKKAAYGPPSEIIRPNVRPKS